MKVIFKWELLGRRAERVAISKGESRNKKAFRKGRELRKDNVETRTKVNRPNTRARSNVKYVVDTTLYFLNRSKVQFAIQSQQEKLILQVQSILLYLENLCQ